ncbi:MAG TPA: alpha/beta fold hydrolase [Bryobacteraceae bacterium]|nr:alpha/beta fold hydrolase [Bryobacteraceae bacterium]
MYYEVSGHGPPLVFLHAGIADSRMWDGQVKYFSDKYTVVRYDLRGYGKSDAPTAPYVPAEDLYGLLQFLKMDRASIVGSSIGGTQALDMAAAHPQAIAALVVVGGSPGWLQYSEEMNQRTSAIMVNVKEKGPASVVEGWLHDPMLATARTQPRVAQQMRMFVSQNMAGLLGLPFMRPPDIALPKLSNFKMPTLVMVGDHDDPEIVQRAHLITREIPAAQEVVIKNADHMVNLEKPREFNQALDLFLRGLK